MDSVELVTNNDEGEGLLLRRTSSGLKYIIRSGVHKFSLDLTSVQNWYPQAHSSDPLSDEV